MVIRSVTCNHPSFRSVSFEPGFNLVLADQTEDSSLKDTRNGSGKSLLIEILHFCLGANFSTNNPLRHDALKDWTFTLQLEFDSETFEVSRNTARPKVVEIVGNIGSWQLKPIQKLETGLFEMTVEDWNAQLGALCFDLPITGKKSLYFPSFRNLISYFMRHGQGAFISPFENHRSTSEGEKQIYTAFLLGLNWEIARQFQQVKDRRAVLNTLKNAAKQGLVEGLLGSLGALQAEKVRLEDEASRKKKDLDSFRVHPQYEEIEREASELTQLVHELSNKNIADRDILALYESDIGAEKEPNQVDVRDVYEEVGLAFPDKVLRRFEDVEWFHSQLSNNRRQFLQAEIDRILQKIAERTEQIKEITDRSAVFLTILQTYGALEVYTQLQQLYLDTLSRIRDLEVRIQNLRSFEEGKSKLKIEQENLVQAARRDLNERAAIRDEAIRLFNANSEALYDAPGRLAVDVTETGYDFRVEIERAGSEGVSNMKIFCYDLMLAQRWAHETFSPRLLVHDSTLFDPVDERQKAHAFMLAALEAESRGFQYIALLNTDSLPNQELLGDYDIEKHVRITLTDQIDGCLLGVRF